MTSLAQMNLQKIDDHMATAGATNEGLDMTITEQVDKAKAALAAGDEKEALAITAKVLERLGDASVA
ncbi:hypothetical protein [Streptomyces sp. st140]|uniref:hypothetical protein n=1 Tax=Streptomyces sp. st140 TaxID=1828052 RepID=UPI001C54F371|nr:hypothetical protein [Streptomyces sp. st140]